MKRIVAGLVFGFLLASSLAWATVVIYPKALKVRGFAFVDEAGSILGGSTPVAVDLANLPSTLDINVTALPDSGAGAEGEALSLRHNCTTYGSSDFPYTVPVGFVLEITDMLIDGTSSSGETRVLVEPVGTSGWNTLFRSSPPASFHPSTPIVVEAGSTLGATEINCNGALVSGWLRPVS